MEAEGEAPGGVEVAEIAGATEELEEPESEEAPTRPWHYDVVVGRSR